MPPAARVTDLHVCPMVTPGTPPVPHVGGPIIPPCSTNVITGFLPQARVTDKCTCVGPLDSIVKGSLTVLVNNLQAARIGDLCAHGGTITTGLATVLIGDVGSGGSPSGSTVTIKPLEFDKDGDPTGTPDPDAELKKWRADNKEKIEKALTAQRTMLEAKKKELEKWDDAAKAKFKKAFGSDDDAAKKTIQDRIDKMLELNKKMTVDNFKPASPSKPTRFAYVYRTDKDHTVYLDTKFYTAKADGKDGAGGVLAHEMSHFEDIGGTRDKFKDYNDDNPVYGVAKSRQLAKDDPAKALQHADSFEYYLEDVP